jgi:hypothetical protein
MMADWGGSAAGTALSRPTEHSIASQQVLRLQSGRSEAGVCTSEARKIRVTLARTSGRLGFLVGRGTHEATSVAVANGAAVARRNETVTRLLAECFGDLPLNDKSGHRQSP